MTTAAHTYVGTVQYVSGNISWYYIIYYMLCYATVHDMLHAMLYNSLLYVLPCIIRALHVAARASQTPSLISFFSFSYYGRLA
jgi:hypothetical protein